MKTIRWGIIGCGDVIEVKSGPGFQKADGSELVAVMLRDAALAADYAQRHRVPCWYADAQALIDDPEVDAVYIATPHQNPSPGPLPWRMQPEIMGGGLFVDLTSHTLDFLDYLLGPVQRVQGFARNQAGSYPVEDIVSAVFEFPGGVLATGQWSFNNFETIDCITFAGSAGRITLAIFKNEPVGLETTAGMQTFDIPHPAHIQQPMIQQIVDELRGLGRCASTGESALRTTWVMGRVLADYYKAFRSPCTQIKKPDGNPSPETLS